MAKRITQDTFDGVVRENIEEFGMEEQEAIDDVITQFESQGVNLSNIVTTLSLHQQDGSASSHPVLEAVKKLTKIVDGGDCTDEELLESLKLFSQECDVDLAHRGLAASNQAYPVLFSLCERYSSKEYILQYVLEALLSLFNGQPDLITLKGIQFMISHLKNTSADVTQVTIKLICATCFMHEANRQEYVKNGLIGDLLSILKQHQDNKSMIRDVCKTLRTLTLDDDIRAPFGKAHEHAKLMVEQGAIGTVLKALKEPCCQDKATLYDLCSVLGKLAVRNEFCQHVVDLGGLKSVLKILAENLEHQLIVMQVFIVLKAIAGNDDVKTAIVNSGGVGYILNAMDKHIKQPQVCSTGSAAIAAIVLRSPGHCKVVIESDGPVVILKAMAVHPNVRTVQQQSCMALRNIIARTKEYCDLILELGAEELIQQASKHCPDEAKAALRDLGCKVELIERWKGERNNVVHDD